MKKIDYLRTGTIFCILSIIGIYVICLKEISHYHQIAFIIGDDYWLTYVQKLIRMAALGIFLGFLYRFCRKKEKFRHFLKIFIIAVAVCISCDFLILRRIAWLLKNLVVSIWPFLMFWSAGFVKEKIGEDKKNRDQKRTMTYYLLTMFFIWIVEIRAVANWQIFQREPLETLYLVFMAVIVWKMVGTKDKGESQPEENGSMGKEMSVIMPLLLFVAAFRNHERIQDIIRSLGNDISCVSGSRMHVNWLGYRIALLKNGWRGDFSLMGEFQTRVASGCPLVWVNYTKGPVMTVVLVILEAALLYCFYSLIKREEEQNGQQVLPRLVMTALVIRSVMGLMADLFLVTFTNVGILLLRNPGDMIMILYLLYFGYLESDSGEYTVFGKLIEKLQKRKKKTTANSLDETECCNTESGIMIKVRENVMEKGEK